MPESCFESENAQTKMETYTLKNRQGVTASFMPYGATWVSLTLPLDGGREVLLGMNNLEDYKQHTAFLGATVGRYANRIAGGKFSLGAKVYQIALAAGEQHALHGGAQGFDKKVWQVLAHDNKQIRFGLTSEDGDQGFPGKLTLEVTFTLTDNNEVCIDYCATSDKDTLVNLTNHAYFNLDGAESGKDCLAHELFLKTTHYAPTDNDLIPTGELKSITGTNFDFTTPQTVGARLLQDEDQKIAAGYDHAYTFDPQDCDAQTPVARLVSSDKKVTMELLTEKPGVQFYSGNFLAGTPSRTGQYQKHQGLALETQFLPDSPNQDWPQEHDARLLANQSYQYRTVYRFAF